MLQPIATSATASTLPMWLKIIAFAIPQVGVFFIFAPVLAVLGGIYAKHYGLSLTSIAIVLLVAKIFDAVTDPLIGYCSDRWRLKTGTRKPLIFTGGMLLAPCAYFLFVPPEDVGALYFAFWYMAFYLALTLFSVPYAAWAHEFTETSKDKALAFSAMSITTQLGQALFYVLPLMPFFMSTEISPKVLEVTALMGAALLLPGLYLALKWVPNGIAHEAPTNKAAKPRPLVQQLYETGQELVNNRPFLLFICISISMGLAFALWFGVVFIFVDAYLNLGEQFAQISLWGMVCGAVAIPFWYRIVVRWGKRLPWFFANIFFIALFMSTGFLNPDHTGFIAIFILYLLMIFTVASSGVITGPLLCDIIDYGCYQTGHERSGVYFSMLGLLGKIPYAIGGALGLAIIGWLGFDMNAATHSATSIFGLKLAISWLPVLIIIPALVCIYHFPLNEHRMTIIRRRLAQRVDRVKAWQLGGHCPSNETGVR